MTPTHAADPIKQACNHVPLQVKELSAAFGVGQDYIYAMRDAGAPFWGRVSTVAAIMEWWAANPSFTRRKARKSPAMHLPAPGPVPLPARKGLARNGDILVL
tara:strand:- start:5445 stop:5750 length:306 start_codon:yes stop_codon:yes gene_type:complete